MDRRGFLSRASLGLAAALAPAMPPVASSASPGAQTTSKRDLVVALAYDLTSLEDYGLRPYVEFTPSPDQQLELRRFNFRMRRA